MLGVGDQVIIRHFNTFTVTLNLILGSTLFVYLAILWLLGIITFIGTGLASGVIWKVPGIFGFILGEVFVATRISTIKIPIAVIFIIAFLLGVGELIFLVITLIACVSGSSPVPCDSFDVLRLGLLVAGAVIYTLACFVLTGSMLSYNAGVRRKISLLSEERAAQELDEQEAQEADTGLF